MSVDAEEERRLLYFVMDGFIDLLGEEAFINFFDSFDYSQFNQDTVKETRRKIFSIHKIVKGDLS